MKVHWWVQNARQSNLGHYLKSSKQFLTSSADKVIIWRFIDGSVRSGPTTAKFALKFEGSSIGYGPLSASSIDHIHISSYMKVHWWNLEQTHTNKFEDVWMCVDFCVSCLVLPFKYGRICTHMQTSAYIQASSNVLVVPAEMYFSLKLKRLYKVKSKEILLSVNDINSTVRSLPE